MARSGDPMSGLLSGLGGIDPSLFQRPQAMKDMKGVTAHRPADAGRPSDSCSLKTVSQPNQQTGNSFARPVEQSRPASDAQFKPALSSSPNKTAFSDKDFSSLLGNNNFAKGGRPMRQATKAAPAPTTNSDWTIDTQSAKSEALSETSLLSPAASFTTQQSAAALPNAADPFQPSPQPSTTAPQPSANLSDTDPFDLFGGPQPAQPVQSQRPAHTDLLQGFGNVQGSADHSRAAVQANAAPLSASPSESFFDFDAPPRQSSVAKAAARSTPLPAYAPDSTRPSTHGAQATHAPTPLASRQAADLAAAPPSSNQSRPAHQPAQPRQQTSSRPAPQPEPQAQAALLMPSYREATSKQAPPLVASPEQGHRRADDWQRPPLGGVRDRRQPSPAAAATDDGYGYDVEPVPRGPRQRQDQGQDVDGLQPQVPAWLANSQKWLKSAGKKVAQAAKETTAQLQARLDEFEGRPARGGVERANSYGADGAPEYFQDWATRIEAMPSDRAAGMLEAMSEQDRLKVQRIIDEHSMEHARAKAASPRSTGPLSARSRRSEAVSRSGTVLSSPQSYPDSPRSFEEDSQQAEAVSRDLHAALSSPRKSLQRKDSDVLSNTSSSQPGSRVTSRKALDPGNAPGSPSQQQSSPTRLSPSSPAFSQHSRQQPAPESPSADFLGFSDTPQSAPAADLMGMDNGFQPEDMFTLPSQAPPQQQQQQPQHRQPPAHAAADDLDIFASPKAAPSTQSRSPADIFSQPAAGRPAAAAARPQAPARTAAGAAMMDFGEEGLPAAAVMAAAGDLDIEGEPELRRELRAQRLARTQARMQEQLAEKQARDAKEEADRSNKGDLRTAVRPRMDAWLAGKKDNIRALLASLDSVLWEGSGWTKPGMADLVEKGRVKRAYMRANLIVHPDKVAQKGGTLEQVVIADMAFDALKTAWAKFEAGELRS